MIHLNPEKDGQGGSIHICETPYVVSQEKEEKVKIKYATEGVPANTTLTVDFNVIATDGEPVGNEAVTGQ